MADLSTYKGLELPKSNERYDVGVVNKNNTIIDSELHKLDLKNESQDELLATKEALNSEMSRATIKENEISGNLNAEVTRAKAAENVLSNDIASEIDRATTEEISISKRLASHILNKLNPHEVTTKQLNLDKVDNTTDMDKPVSSAQQAALDALYEQLTAYVLQKIADLINGAPSTLDTLGEIAQAMQANESVVTALDEAIGRKANAAEFDSHIKDKSNPHKVKATQAEAVSFSESQELSETQKAIARANISAGTSSFSGDYNDLSNAPAIPDISGKVNKSGDTITGQLIGGPVDYFYLYGRNGAMIRRNGAPNSYDPILSSITGTGSWDLGAVDNIMHLFYISDADYNNGTYNEIADIQFRSNGTIGATADNAQKWNGKSLVYISENAFQNLASKDSNTIYFRYKG